MLKFNKLNQINAIIFNRHPIIIKITANNFLFIKILINFEKPKPKIKKGIAKAENIAKSSHQGISKVLIPLLIILS